MEQKPSPDPPPPPPSPNAPAPPLRLNQPKGDPFTGRQAVGPIEEEGGQAGRPAEDRAGWTMAAQWFLLAILIFLAVLLFWWARGS